MRWVSAALFICVASVCHSGNILNSNDISSGIVTSAGTASTCSGDQDMFPDKVVVSGPEFSITYNTTFKVLTNLMANEKYVLVQRGCPTPTLPDGFVAKAVVQVPVARVSVTSVTDSKWIELIGERNSLIGMPGIYTTSPCVNKRYDLGLTVDMNMVSYNSTLSQYQMNSNPKTLTGTYASVLSTPLDVVFAGWFGASAGPPLVITSSIYEKSYKLVPEWGKFIAAFYNKEATINALISDFKTRWDCASQRAIVAAAAAVAAGSTKPKGLAISYISGTTITPFDCSFNAASGLWANKICEVLDAAGLQVVDAVHSYTGSYSNYQQFGDWAADVDVIIVADSTCTYKGATTVAACDELWKLKFLSSLSATKAFKNQKIYDVGRTLDPGGGTDYFVSLPVEPDAFLADVVAVTYPAAAVGHNMVYLRNMFTEGVGNLRSCNDYNLTFGCVPSEASLSAKCTSLGAPAEAADQSFCSACAAGSFASDSGLMYCSVCGTGTYTSAAGFSVCSECATGTFGAGTGWTACAKCATGSYGSTSGLSSCSACETGSYANASGLVACDKCGAGSFTSETGLFVCSQCSSGTFTSDSGVSSCSLCMTGSYGTGNGQSACNACAEGSFASDSGLMYCSVCGTGTYTSAAGFSVCSECATGTFGAGTGWTACAKCATGSYGSTSASTVCSLCNFGSYTSTTASTVCSLCSIGTYSSMQGLTRCELCAAGKSSSTLGANACGDCAAGFYAPVSGAWTCAICSAGSYNINSGSTTCQGCAAGSFALDGASACALCSIGSFVSAPSSTACTKCGVGLFTSSLGSSACASCPAGTSTSAPGAASASLCVAQTQQLAVSMVLQAAPETFLDSTVRQKVVAAVASALGVSASQVTATWPAASRVLVRRMGVRAATTAVTFTVAVDAAGAEHIQARAVSDIEASVNTELASRGLPPAGDVSLSDSSGTKASSQGGESSGAGISLIAGAAGGGGGALLAVICLVCVLRAQRMCCWSPRENRTNAPNIKATELEPLNASAPGSAAESPDFVFNRKAIGDGRRDAGTPSAPPLVAAVTPAASIKAGVADQDRPTKALTAEPTETGPAEGPAESLSDKTKPAGRAAVKNDAVPSKDSQAGPPAVGETPVSEPLISIAASVSIAAKPGVESATKTKAAEVPGPIKKLGDPTVGVAGSAMIKEPAGDASSLVDTGQVDPPSSSHALAKAEKTFSNSHYKALYGCELPDHYFKLMNYVVDFLSAVGRSKQLSKKDVKTFVDQLHAECAGISEGPEASPSLLKKRFHESLVVSDHAQRLWTCTEQMQGKEFCFYINDALRNDDKELLTLLMPVIRAINANCVAQRGAESAIPRDVWPANGLCYRGGELPKAHHGFYSAGRKYRVPGFLATSLQQGVADSFIKRHFFLSGSDCVVLWIIQVPPNCAQVSFVEHSNVGREQEFLFAPYSVFTVLRVELSPAPSELAPHRVFLSAAQDNRSEPEDLPLAPWF